MKFILLLLSLHAVVVFAQNYTDASGKKQGKWVKYYPNGHISIYEGVFKDDHPVGEFRYYYPSGKVKTIVQHETKTRSYAWFYFENEQIMSEGQYVNMQKDSVWKTYNVQGFLISSESYAKNKLNGQKIMYYVQDQLENGDLKIFQIETYKDSVLHGEFTAYFSSGIKMEYGRYELGKKVGRWETFHPSGNVATQVKFRKGMAYGYAVAFDDKGQEQYRSYWLDGKVLKGEELKKYFAQCQKNGMSPEE